MVFIRVPSGRGRDGGSCLGNGWKRVEWVPDDFMSVWEHSPDKDSEGETRRKLCLATGKCWLRTSGTIARPIEPAGKRSRRRFGRGSLWVLG